MVEYACNRFLNGRLCNGSELGLPQEMEVDKVKLWQSCNTHACYTLNKRLHDIIITNMTVTLGEEIKLTCLDKDYLYSLKENMSKEAILRVHWFHNEKDYHQQTNSIVFTVASLKDTGVAG